jgi:hypothetical protein
MSPTLSILLASLALVVIAGSTVLVLDWWSKR